ncbi:serine/threonine-protein kinase [Mammaliicoccus lentus]|uniref:serine/threonine-protein kinase n=1 Tax=Mammaliicoccus lentus TaxID=42858 RepID=UPI00264822C9|nr:serine/threonine-protein kinase [Mammaliicoccus lentus]
MGLQTYNDYRLKKIGQELNSSCPIIYPQINHKPKKQLLKVTKHNEIWLIKIKQQSYIIKKAIKNSYLDQNNKKLLEEGRKLKILKHKNIVKCHSIYDKFNVYLVLDYIKGKTLEYILKNTLLNLSTIYKITLEILGAIDFLHKMNIIHNDLNPSNIIYSEDRQEIVIIDLGISTYTDSHQSKMGAAQFAAPEQLLGQRPTYKTDIWAIGCILFYCIEGHRPFKKNREQLDQKNIVISTIIPNNFKKLILSMLELDSAKRPNINECIKEINKLKMLCK